MGGDYVILIQLMPHCSLWVVPGSQGYLSEHCTLLKHYYLLCVSVHLDVMDQTAVHKVILRWLHTIWTLKTFSTSYKTEKLHKLLISRSPRWIENRVLSDDLLSQGTISFFLGFNWPYSCLKVSTLDVWQQGEEKLCLIRIDHSNTHSHCAILEGVKW